MSKRLYNDHSILGRYGTMYHQKFKLSGIVFGVSIRPSENIRKGERKNKVVCLYVRVFNASVGV